MQTRRQQKLGKQPERATQRRAARPNDSRRRIGLLLEMEGPRHGEMSWLLTPAGRFVVIGPLQSEEESRLSATENEVLRSILAGDSNEQIGRRRQRSSRTIANQVRSIFRKLGVSSRRELVARLFQKTSSPT
jgi:DNA-binding CsgD family transcriptional regulator